MTAEKFIGKSIASGPEKHNKQWMIELNFTAKREKNQ